MKFLVNLTFFAPWLPIMEWGYWNRCSQQEYYKIEQIQQEAAISKLDGHGNHFTLVEEEDNYTYVLQYIRNNN